MADRRSLTQLKIQARADSILAYFKPERRKGMKDKKILRQQHIDSDFQTQRRLFEALEDLSEKLTEVENQQQVTLLILNIRNEINQLGRYIVNGHRKQIDFSAIIDFDSGEVCGNLIIPKEITKQNGLWKADVFSDLSGMFETLRIEALEQFNKEELEPIHLQRQEKLSD